MDVQRITLDVPVDLNNEINESAKRTNMTKAQYMRMALQVLNMLSTDRHCEIIIVKSSGEKRGLFIPGITN